jgi:hypothetical protein
LPGENLVMHAELDIDTRGNYMQLVKFVDAKVHDRKVKGLHNTPEANVIMHNLALKKRKLMILLVIWMQ